MPCLMPCVWTERGNLLWAMRVSYCVSISHIRNPPAPVWRGNSLIFKVWFSDAFHRTTVWAPITKSLSDNGWTPYNLTNEKSPFVQVIFWCRRQQAINRTNTDPDLCRHIASLSHNELDKGVFPNEYIHTPMALSIPLSWTVFFRKTGNQQLKSKFKII